MPTIRGGYWQGLDGAVLLDAEQILGDQGYLYFGERRVTFQVSPLRQLVWLIATKRDFGNPFETFWCPIYNPDVKKSSLGGDILGWSA